MRDLLAEVGDTQFSNTVKDYLEITTGFGFEIVYVEPFKADNRDENLYILFHKELGILIDFDSFTWDNKSEPNVNGGNMYYNWSPNSLSQRHSLTSSGHFLFEQKGKHMTLFEKDLVTRYEITDYPNTVKWDKDITWYELKAINKPIEEMQINLFNNAVKAGKRFLWIGGHDCREGVITTIKAMFENGKFLPVWHDCPFSWITNYMEHKNSNMQYPFTALYEKTKERISRMPEYVQNCINNTYQKAINS